MIETTSTRPLLCKLSTNWNIKAQCMQTCTLTWPIKWKFLFWFLLNVHERILYFKFLISSPRATREKEKKERRKRKKKKTDMNGENHTSHYQKVRRGNSDRQSSTITLRDHFEMDEQEGSRTIGMRKRAKSRMSGGIGGRTSNMTLKRPNAVFTYCPHELSDCRFGGHERLNPS